MNTQCKMNPNAFYGSTIHSFKALSGHWKHNNDKIKKLSVYTLEAYILLEGDRNEAGTARRSSGRGRCRTVGDNLLGLTGHRNASALSGIQAEESQDLTF